MKFEHEVIYPKKPDYKLTLDLSHGQVRALAGLLDSVIWHHQPEDVAEVLQALHTYLTDDVLESYVEWDEVGLKLRH